MRSIVTLASLLFASSLARAQSPEGVDEDLDLAGLDERPIWSDGPIESLDVAPEALPLPRDGAQIPANEIALPTGEQKSGVTPQALSVPSDGGSVEGLGESFSPMLSTGTATMSVPIALPAGRAGVQPSLALAYSSSGGNGPLGIGWSLQVPFIARQTDRGLPRYDGTDRFVYNGGQELVPVALSGDADGDPSNGEDPETVPAALEGYRLFRARVEGAFLRFFQAADESHWVVQDRNGALFYLGETEDARVEEAGWGVYSWSVTRIVDLHGNEVRFLYRAKDDDRQVYVSEVVWNSPVVEGAPDTAAEPDEFQHAVRLAYETRDDAIDSYVARFRVTTALRLARIDVSSFLEAADPERTPGRTYELTYDPGSFVSLLESVRVVGRDGLALPPMTFGYSAIEPHAGPGGDLSEDLPGWGGFDGRVLELENSPSHSLDEARTDLFDVDQDAFPDVLVTDPARYDDGHGVFFLDFVDGVGTYTGAHIVEVPRSVDGSLSLSNTNVHPMDLDADGRVELLHMPHLRDWSAYTAEGSRAAGFEWVEKGPFDPADPDIDLTRDAAEIRLVDLDNDHRVDVLRTSGTETQFFRNAGDGTFDAAVTSCVLHRGMPLRFSNGDLQLADMNGDGIQDLVHLRRGDLAYWAGRGPGLFGGDADLPEDCAAGEYGDSREVVMEDSPLWSDLEDDRVRLADVNGDGLSDVVQTRFDGVDLWVNQGGKSFTDRYILERSPFDPAFTQRVRIADIDASGSKDVVWGDGDRYRAMDLSGGIRPRLLTRVDNGLGKTTLLEYEPHTAQQSRAADAGQPFASTTPFPVQVVSRMTVRDDLGGQYVTEYRYRDPLYDGVEAEFRGFGEATVVTIGDANSPTSLTRTVFWRGERPDGSDPDDNPYEALKGAVRLTETCDEEGVCLETSHTTYAVRRLYAGLGDPRSVWHAFAERVDTFRYDTADWDPSADTVTLDAVTGDAPFAEDVVALRAEGRAQLAAETSMDGAGNVTRDAKLGVAGDPDDDVVVVSTHQNLSDWLWRPDVEETEPDLRVTTRTFDAFGQLTDEEVYLGEESRDVLAAHNEYDGLGLLTEVEEGGTGAAALRHRALTYDPDFGSTLVAEEIFTDESASLVTSATWDAGLGVVTELRDFNDEPTAIEYDGLGRVVAIVRPGCAEAAVTYQYLLAGDLGVAFNEVVTRANESCGDGEPVDLGSSLETHAFVDGLGRARLTVSEADTARGDAGAWVRSGLVAFDAKGGESRKYLPDYRDDADLDLAEPAGRFASTRYDAFGRPVSEIATDRTARADTSYGALSKTVWDPNDTDAGSAHADTPTTTLEDGQGRLVETIERNRVGMAVEEYLTTFEYDPLGNVTRIDRSFDATTVTRTFTYDSLGRRIENADPDSGLWLYEYTDAGDLSATEDANGTRVSYEYDRAGRLLTEDHEDDASVEVTYGYDDPTAGRFGLGRLTSVDDQSGDLALDYDARGRTVAMRRTLDFDSTERQEESTYDEQDRLVSQEYPDGSVASYEYTDRGLLYAVELLHDAELDTQIDDLQPVVTRLEYDASGKRLVLERGDADVTTTEYTFDDRERLATLHTETSLARVFQDLSYTYDRVSNIVAIEDTRDVSDTTGWAPSPADQAFEYDALYRLTQVDSTYDVSEPTRPVTQTWAYDFLGNMTSWTDDQDEFYGRSLGDIENGVDTNPALRPSALVAADLDANNHLEATYTDTGDMESLSVTKAGTTTVTDLVWDPVHRLASVTIGAATTDFAYDHADQRRVKDGPAGTVLYVSDDFEVRDTEATKWLMVGTERLLRVTTETSATEVSFYLHDHLGTSAIVLDAADSEPRVASTSLPYGATEAEVVSDAGFEAEYEFTGKERDQETGLDYFGARYYASHLGRWASPDPISVHSDSDKLRNPYRYALSNPLVLVDPNGLDEEEAPASSGTTSWGRGFRETLFLNAREFYVYLQTGTAPGQLFMSGPTPEAELNPRSTQRTLFRAIHELNAPVPEARNRARGNIAAELVTLLGPAAIARGATLARRLANQARTRRSAIDAARRGFLAVLEARAESGTQRALEILRPQGHLIGEAGTSSRIRILRGGQAEAQALFDQLARGGEIVQGTSHPGTLVRLSGGGQVGFRATSTSGPPTIDVRIEGLGVREIKFLE